MISKNYKLYKASLKSIKDYWINNPCEEWFFGPGINCKNINQIDLVQFPSHICKYLYTSSPDSSVDYSPFQNL